MNIEIELRNYLDNMNRIKIYPSKKKYKILALIYLSTKFEKEVIYTEKEVNEILNNYHTFNDCCLLRRELFNNKFIGRLENCSEYWMEERQPTFNDFKFD
jgi:hypothetical protein